MSLIEKPECNDGSSEICDILHTNQVYTIIDIINIDPESLKSIYKTMSYRKYKLYLTIIQNNSVNTL